MAVAKDWSPTKQRRIGEKRGEFRLESLRLILPDADSVLVVFDDAGAFVRYVPHRRGAS